MNIPKYIVIHCSDVSEKKAFDQFKSIDSYHKQQDFPKSSLGYYVGYHRLITGGKNYKCKEDNEIGAHTNQVVDGTTMNKQSLGICWGGDGDVEFPSQVHYDLLKAQVKEWMVEYRIHRDNVRFHRSFAVSKTCPGSLLTKEWLENLLERPVDKPIDQKVKQVAILEQISIIQQMINRLRLLLNMV